MRTYYNIIVLFMTNETALFGFSCQFTRHKQFRKTYICGLG